MASGATGGVRGEPFREDSASRTRQAIDIMSLFPPANDAPVERPVEQYSEPLWEYGGPDVEALRDCVLQLRGNRTNAAHAVPRGTVNKLVSLEDATRDCMVALQRLTPSHDEMQAAHACFLRLKKILEARYPGSTLHLFGSVANGLCLTANNDLDVTLMVSNAELARAAASRRAAVSSAAQHRSAAAVAGAAAAAVMAESAAAGSTRAPEAKSHLVEGEGLQTNGESQAGEERPQKQEGRVGLAHPRQKWATTDEHAGKAQLVSELAQVFEADGMEVRPALTHRRWHGVSAELLQPAL
jgi:hypothetical protein